MPKPHAGVIPTHNRLENYRLLVLRTRQRRRFSTGRMQWHGGGWGGVGVSIQGCSVSSSKHEKVHLSKRGHDVLLPNVPKRTENGRYFTETVTFPRMEEDTSFISKSDTRIIGNE